MTRSRPELETRLARRSAAGGFLNGLMLPLNVPVSPGMVAAIFGLIHGDRPARQLRTPIVLLGVAVAATALSRLLHGMVIVNHDVAIFGAMLVMLLGGSRWFLSERDAVSVFKGLMWADLILTALLPGGIRSGFGTAWKYGLDVPAIGLLCLYFPGRVVHSRAVIAAVGLVAIGIGSLFVNARSDAMICLVAAAIWSIGALGGRTFLPRLLLAAVVVTGVVIGASLLIHAIERGAFGADVQTKTLQQSDSTAPLLFAGRTEPPLALSVVKGSPWIGWGSLSDLPNPVINQGLAYAERLGLDDPNALLHIWMRHAPSVELHSVVTTAWAVGGVGAAAFPLWLIVRCIVLAWRAPAGLHNSLFWVYLALSVVWGGLFSPMSNEQAAIWAFTAGAVMNYRSWRDPLRDGESVRGTGSSVRFTVPSRGGK